MRKGSMGGSMGGGLIHIPQKPPEKNTADCPVCHEKRRFPCRAKESGRVLSTTHTTAAKRRARKRAGR